MDSPHVRETHLSDGFHRLDTTSTKASKAFFGIIIRKDTTSSQSEAMDSAKGNFGLMTLYTPPNAEPVVGLVFVHGLNGGSQSTWTKGHESNFWPKTWLPRDEAFKDARIHTFGYHSGLSRESVLNIQDFARSFLGAIHDAPCIPLEAKVSWMATRVDGDGDGTYTSSTSWPGSTGFCQSQHGRPGHQNGLRPRSPSHAVWLGGQKNQRHDFPELPS